MLRHRRSLAAFASVSSATESTNDPEEEDEEDDGPPLPLGLARASMRTTPRKPASSAASVNGNGKPMKDNGLIRRVSSLFRSSSSSKNTGSFTPTARYTSAASTPDVRLVTGGTFIKRTTSASAKSSLQSPPPSLSNSTSTSTPNRSRSLASSLASSLGRSPKSKLSALPALPRSFPPAISSGKAAKNSKAKSKFGRGKPLPVPSSSASDEEDEEDDIRRPSGLGQAASLLGSASEEEPSYSTSYAARGRGSASASSEDASEDGQGDEEGEDDIRRPAGLGPPAVGGFGGEEWQFGVRRPEGWLPGRGAGASPSSSAFPSPSRGSLGGRDDARGARITVFPTSARGAVFPRTADNSNEGSDDGDGDGRNGRARDGPRTRAHSAPMAALFRFPLPPPSSGSSPSSPSVSVPSPSPLNFLHTNAGSMPKSTPGSAPKSTSPPKEDSPPGSRPRSPPCVPPKSAQRQADLLFQRKRERRTAPPLPAPLWALILSFSFPHLTGEGEGDFHLTEADAASVARVCRAACEGARGRLYGEVCFGSALLGRGETTPTSGDRRAQQLRASLRRPHLARCVEGVVCAGWPPWGGERGLNEPEIYLPALRSLTIFPPDSPSPSPSSPSSPSSVPTPTLDTRSQPPAQGLDTPALLSFLASHPTLERLAVVGGEDAADDTSEVEATEDPRARERESKTEGRPFLPRLTHLHAPPALAVRVLARLSSIAPLSTSSSGVNGTGKLSPAALALLAPDAKKERKWALAGALVASAGAGAGALVSASALAASKQAEGGRDASALPAGGSASASPAGGSASTSTAGSAETLTGLGNASPGGKRRIRRKPAPTFVDDEIALVGVNGMNGKRAVSAPALAGGDNGLRQQRTHGTRCACCASRCRGRCTRARRRSASSGT
ncbi:hypothetical protein C8R44DRAFT_778231, partial [Mycena epipterygia]